jgi:hypothetical protein
MYPSVSVPTAPDFLAQFKVATLSSAADLNRALAVSATGMESYTRARDIVARDLERAVAHHTSAFTKLQEITARHAADVIAATAGIERFQAYLAKHQAQRDAAIEQAMSGIQVLCKQWDDWQAATARHIAATIETAQQATRRLVEQASAGLAVFTRHLPWILCTRALRAVLDCDLETVTAFVQQHLRLPASDVWCIAELLWRGGWRNAENPFAYLVQAARYQRARCTHGVHRSECTFCAGVGQRGAPRQPMALLSQPVDPRKPQGDTWEDQLKDQSGADDYAQVELRHDLARAFQLAQLDDDVQQVAAARGHGVSRRAIAAALGWSPTRAERAWKALYRAAPRLQQALLVDL